MLFVFMSRINEQVSSHNTHTSTLSLVEPAVSTQLPLCQGSKPAVSTQLPLCQGS